MEMRAAVSEIQPVNLGVALAGDEAVADDQHDHDGGDAWNAARLHKRLYDRRGGAEDVHAHARQDATCEAESE